MTWRKRENIMLCQPMDDKNLERIFNDAGCAFCQPKLDGERCWINATHAMEVPELISSTGRRIISMPHIELALKEFLNITGKPFPLDGELYEKGNSFEQIASKINRTVHLHSEYVDMVYHVFDIKTQEPQATRLLRLAEIFNKWKEIVDPLYKDLIKLVPFELAETIEDVHKYYAQYILQDYEGIIVRHPKAPYHIGRPWYVLKFKPKKRDTYNFVRFDEAFSAEGLPLARVGAIVCSDTEGNTFRVGPGVGYSIYMLQEIWRKRHCYTPDWSVVVDYQNLTHTGGVPRFGKFVEIIK